MSDFVAFADEIGEGMEYLEHHGILNQRWGHRNGPPYPLSRSDHSAAEKSAAKKAGITVGSSSGKGSIAVINKSGGRSKSTAKTAKRELTPEEKREKALEAVRVGDKKKITKYMDYLTTEELRDAQARSQMKDSLSKEDQNKASKEDLAKLEAIRSGDKEKVKEYADKMSYQELVEAMNKVDLTEKLNRVPPEPTALDKLTNVMNKVDQFRSAAEKGIAAYNTAAKVYNSTHKDGGQWPIIGYDQNGGKDKSQEQKIAESLAKQMSKDVQQGLKQTQKQNQEKSFKEQSKEQLQNAKIDYKNQKKFEKWKEKQEAKESAKDKAAAEERDRQTTQELNQKVEEKRQQEVQRQYTPERAPQVNKADFKYEKKEGEGEDTKYYYKPEKAPEVRSAKFNTNKQESQSQEPTERQKELVDQARKSDDYYLNQLKNTTTKKVDDYSNVSYSDLFSDSYKDSMRQSYEKSVKLAEQDAYYQSIYDYMYNQH